MILLTATVYFYAMTLPKNSPLRWEEALTLKQCRYIERRSRETWCLRIDVPPKISKQEN